MKKIFTLSILLLLYTVAAYAQSYKWIRGGGSTDHLSNGAIQEEYVKFICTDDNKNVYILAQVGRNNIRVDTFNRSAVEPFITWHLIFASYDCNGKTRFVKLLESSSTDGAHGLVYSKGHIYLSGYLGGTGKRLGNDATFASQYQNCFIAKYDTSGQYRWAQFVGADEISTRYNAGGFNSPLGVDGSGNLHYFISMKKGLKITPSITSLTATYDLKYDVNGNLQSVNMLQQPDSDYHAIGAAIDQMTGNTYISFLQTSFNTAKTPMIFAAFSNTGSLIWKDTCGLHGTVTGFRLAPDGIYICGANNTQQAFSIGGMSIRNSSYNQGPFSIIGKLDYQGNAKWLETIDNYTANHALSDIELLPNNQIAAVGLFNGKSRYKADSIISPGGASVNPLLIVLDTTRTLMSMQMIPSTGSSAGYVITKDKYGSMYIGGKVGATITPPGITGYSSNGGNSDFYLIKYGYDCNCTAMPTAAFSFAQDGLTGKIRFYYNGHKPADSVVWDFGDYTAKVKLDSPVHIYAIGGNYRACATVYTPCGTHRVCKWLKAGIPESVAELNHANINMYPNPAQQQLTIEGIATGTTLQLVDMLGRVVYRGIANGSKEIINTQTISIGSYILHLTAKDGSNASYRIEKQ